ncbi:MAG UNVERIFIED_CONTAM: hypothetical protein LVT10_03575 [Anaerolineae bacterium]|jgi:hypothetical protein
MRGARYDKGLRELINALNRQFLEGVGNLEAVAPLPQLAQPLRPSQDARDFPAPDHERLYRELAQPETTHERRREIGDLLALRGDARRGSGGQGRHTRNRLGGSARNKRGKSLIWQDGRV